MAYVAGVLLMVMSPEVPLPAFNYFLQSVKEAFWVLVAILDTYGLASFYEPRMTGILEQCTLFEEVLHIYKTDLANHFVLFVVETLLI